MPWQDQNLILIRNWMAHELPNCNHVPIIAYIIVSDSTKVILLGTIIYTMLNRKCGLIPATRSTLLSNKINFNLLIGALCTFCVPNFKMGSGFLFINSTFRFIFLF